MRSSKLGSLFTLAMLVASCGGDEVGTDAGGPEVDAGALVGPSATLSWQVRCVSGRCPAEEPPARTIDAQNGQDGHEVACDLTLEGEDRRLDLTARHSDGYGIEVRGARVGPMGGRLLGSLCQIRVFEPTDTTVFEPCGSNLPTADRACQLQRVDIRDVDGVPTLEAELRCASAESEGDPLALRDVTSTTSTSGYAQLTFTGCEGL